VGTDVNLGLCYFDNYKVFFGEICRSIFWFRFDFWMYFNF